MDNMCAKEKLSNMLLHQDGRAFGIAVLYIVYKTIEHNDNITLNKLKKLLSSDLLLRDTVVDGAVASLGSKSVFNAISMWSPPRKDPGPRTVHLRLPRERSSEFQRWLESSLAEYPELHAFTPAQIGSDRRPE